MSADLHLNLDQSDKLTLIIFENSPLNRKGVSAIKTPKKVSSKIKLNGYDPNYWKDYTIVEPNEVIRSFKTVDE